MQVPEKYYDEVFDFKGQWDMPSRCGLRILPNAAKSPAQQEKTVVIVTELYQDNPGTSVTAAGKSLAEQICRAKDMDIDKIMYVHCNPGTNSKLSFYDEEFYEVIFSDNAEHSLGCEHSFRCEPSYRQLTAEEIGKL